ncbi:ABC transporter permease [Mucilaginibacter phyllosphaerae]|uniref:ABC transporter permease n=1 Tax=Mucilaginibacter phyllosphaerae TaxID=1812349 RepID=A0A4Y8A951_9SPHI|nr:ABC transporter permease [Mucilaginibacter phyllosphaerae]MBB3969620.1 ABC-type antimicrobial peptide transport system permease subunit [Mucilaginibacter phyllosphaerae]TEW65007.1 ABC transporter permease [Mucilaginibacter phyllosphaerae]GGH18557.1 ABC transporter permease [Mucilaginibacter phyllosphaerae]
MFKNYLKISWRNLTKNKAHTFINVTGLSVGMAVAMLIGLWIWDEVSYDKYFKNHDKIVQVWQHQTFNGKVGSQIAMPIPLGTMLRNDYTGKDKDFKYTVLSSWNFEHILALGDKKITQQGSFMQAEAPEMLSLKMLKGTRAGLADPSSVLLSQKVAKALFGDADPMNKTLKLDNKDLVKVTGVYEDIPHNSSFNELSMILPWDLYLSSQDWVKRSASQWGNNSFQIFAQLNDHADIGKVSARIKGIKEKNIALAGDKVGASFKPVVFLHPMDKWHLRSEFKDGVNTGGAIQFVWMFGIIGTFVLLLACINFMNLSTARSEKRAKEVGIRKTVGSLRSQLIGQFFSESLMVVAFAFLLSVILVLLTLPWFNQVADKTMTVLWANPVFWLMGLGFSLLTGLIAGSYPAFYLSSFQPVKVLKGTFKAGRYAALPRKILVVLQFTVSVTLIIGTIVVFRQVQHTKNRAVGYERTGLLQMNMKSDDIHKNFAAVRNDLLQSGVIEEMAESGSPLTDVYSNNSGLTWRGKPAGLQDDFGTIRITHEFGKVAKWKVVEGRDFSRAFVSDSTGMILNESAAKFMNFKHPVGEIIEWGGKYKVIGVVKDMVMSSPYEPVKPSIFILQNFDGGIVDIRLNPKVSTREALGKIEAVFKQYDPGSPFDYKFTDDEYNKKFANEERVGKLAGFFTLLAIFISCMGLFGMASFMAEQRIKEIGVRKVLGASVFNLWKLMSADFIILVSIALLFAIPTAYYFMHNWLQDYKYRAELSWWIFALTAVGAITITILTVSYQSIKAALTNPVKSLKTE